MKWIKDLHYCFQKQSGEVSKFVGSCNHNNTTIIISHRYYLQTQRGFLSSRTCTTGGGLRDRWPVKNVFSNGLYSSSLNENYLDISSNIARRRYGHSPNDPNLSRDWLVKLWVLEKKKIKSSRRKQQRYVQPDSNVFENLPSFQMPFGKLFSGAPVAEEKSKMKTIAHQPPLSQPTIGFLEPTSLEEVKVAPLLARSNLLITRDIEWANLMLGFEQSRPEKVLFARKLIARDVRYKKTYGLLHEENRYAVVDACYPQSPVGFIREQSNLIARQLLRTRRPFIASITDAMGNELFRVRRPFWWITSTIYVEIDGKEIGVVHRRWHLWRRVYDLYLGNKQFAVVENPGFWHWTFTLQDVDGNTLAEIDRDWRGFGFELLTDAGQYVIRFGQVDPSTKTGPAVAVQDLEVTRPLTLSERAVAVALAVSLDNDYFSRHGGWGLPFIAVGE